MNRFDYASGAYRFELDRRRDLNAAVTAPAGIVTLFVAALLALALELRFPLDWIGAWLGMMCMIAAALACTSIFFLIRAYHSYEYRYVQTMEELEEWRREVISLGYTPAQADEQLQDVLIAAFADATMKNTLNNEAKSAFLYRGTRWMIGCLIALALASPPYLLAKRQSDALKQASSIATCICAKESNDGRTSLTRPSASTPAPTSSGRSGERGAARIPDAQVAPNSTGR